MADIFSLPPLAGQSDTLQKAQGFFGPGTERLLAFQKENKLTGEDVLNLGLANMLFDTQQQEDRQRRAAEVAYELQLKAAKEAQKLGKESLAYTSMMNQINNLPGTIASAFGGAGERELMQNLYGKIPEIVSETSRTFPRMQIQPVAYGMPSSKYFS